MLSLRVEKSTPSVSTCRFEFGRTRGRGSPSAPPRTLKAPLPTAVPFPTGNAAVLRQHSRAAQGRGRTERKPQPQENKKKSTCPPVAGKEKKMLPHPHNNSGPRFC